MATTTTPGERVRALRKKLDLTQESIAEATGYSRVTIVDVESGENQLSSFPLRAALATAFGVELAAFLSYVDGGASLTDVLATRSAE